MKSARPVVAGIDAGGTMTDTILVDEYGTFTIGKAATTPQLESIGFLESAIEASDYRGIAIEDMFASVEVVLYTGTGMLNVLLSRTGRNIGLITNKGIEDMVLMGRGLQSWGDYSYADRLHAVTHHHPPPLVARRNTHGVTGRMDHMGDEIIPLYEHEVEQAVNTLVEKEVEVICICFLFSQVNPSHEILAEEIARTILLRRKAKTELLCSHQVRPVIREQSRLNSLLIEAYATGGGRKQLKSIEKAARENGYRYGVQTLQSFGGLTSINHPNLHETMVSGPIGGVLGARYISQIIKNDSLVVSDLGGTSFDMGIISKGQIRIDQEPLIGRFKLNLPLIAMDTIGAGAGMHVKVDPLTKKVSLGPESAGSEPGPICFDKGNLVPTICDYNAILGRLNPYYFLGGKVTLNVDLAYEKFKETCVDLLGVDNVYDVAEGMINMLDSEAGVALRRLLSAQGIHPSEYTLLSYGGSGPLHLGGYSRGIGFKDIITFQFAAAFSAFGCTTADFQKRFSRSVHLDIPLDTPFTDLQEAVFTINNIWDDLKNKALEQMVSEGHSADKIGFQPFLLMRYTGQLEDVEVYSPIDKINGADEFDLVISTFRNIYRNINRSVSDYGQTSVSVMEMGMIASVEKIKPRLKKARLGKSKPEERTCKGHRKVYFNGRWEKTLLWEMDEILPGNEIRGPAIIEHPATTLVIHPGDEVFMDEWSMLHYRHQSEG
ncbi:MAG: hydantoinase/oxoprolinase family protein [Rhodobacteraceae bacterium]|nr:hydantoinase/oxoprolinase family protein [Paracoccaceae bacterium]MCY4249847.1 hydantoinase/oxoprolinase family protein [Paracoccaceae bacterium]